MWRGRFVAGVNTVSSTLEWTLLLLAKHPLEQARARSDACRHQQLHRPQGDGPRAPAPCSPYVDAVLCEVLRYKPPLLLPRVATRDATIGGFAVPSGTLVLANNYALTRSERWWSAADAFRLQAHLDRVKGVPCQHKCYTAAIPSHEVADARPRTVGGRHGTQQWMVAHLSTRSS